MMTSSVNNIAETAWWIIKPRNYLKLLLPRILYHSIVLATYIFWFVVGCFILRKTDRAIKAVSYVKTYGDTVALSTIEESDVFKELLHTIDTEFTKPPAILLLNQYALNMTFNFLCNTKTLKGVHERLIFVTLDQKAHDVLNEYWPEVRQLYWPTPSLYKPFSFAEGPYQQIYLLRANLAVSLLKNGKSFWMMQQDTFWRKNLFELELENDMSFDALFDQIGDDGNSQRAEWVNGANFFVRANNGTLKFFQRVADKLAHWYTPDMGIMIHQCHTWGNPKCAFIPHKIAHSWEWMYTKQENPPYIIQLDCETDGGTKLMQLAKYGFHFTKEDGRTCDYEAVEKIREKMGKGKIEVHRAKLSWGRLQFKVYWWIVDYILMTPVIGPLLKPYLPLLGFILMITL
uniref:Nucleotid_trans domain-containing protein n=1 Tax=Strongyloides papillosus TaxID=174720 RepID=A0A0N5BDE1_STREA